MANCFRELSKSFTHVGIFPTNPPQRLFTPVVESQVGTKLTHRFGIERFISLFSIAIAMVTTVQLRETTKQLLEKLKAREKAESYDALIMGLLKSRIEVKDMFGFTRKKPLKFSREDEMSFNEL